MKKTILMFCAAVLALVSCQKGLEAPEAGNGTPAEIVFNLGASHPGDTKAVKTAWETDDVIFVFFSTQAAPRYLEMKWNGTSWVNTPKNGLSLTDNETGTMRAVFLPFGSDAAVSASETSFTFSTTYYTYYLTATLDYTVAGGAVSGTFNMQIPEDYVQFFIDDASAVDGAYTLGTDAVVPVGIASVAADGAITETSDKNAGDDMVGYVYGTGAAKGYLFSGKLDAGYHAYRLSGTTDSAVEVNAYYLAKKKASDSGRADYFVTGKTLASRSAVKLPANDDIYTPSNLSGKWVPVGSDKRIQLFKSDNTNLGVWYSCNYNQSVPEALGDREYFFIANAHGVMLPTREQFQSILDNCTWTWLTVHGRPGVVVRADRAFIFLPAYVSTHGAYWSSTYNSTSAFPYSHLVIRKNGSLSNGVIGDDQFLFCIRPFEN